MRYYHVIFNTSSEEIKEKAKVNLREYSYDSPIASVNNYMYRNLQKELSFLAYQEEENLVYAVFAYNEKKIMYQDAYQAITEMLKADFFIKKVKEDPYEITMHQFMDCILESRRRQYLDYSNKIIDSTHLWIYYCNSADSDFRNTNYHFTERIISGKERKNYFLYDQKFIGELENIETHQNTSAYSGNMVHYILSSRSIEAASDMVETLMQKLLKANRIGSRRMEVISEIDPAFYKGNNHIEEIIENNVGGVIVFDLSEKFGYDSTDYLSASQYLEMMVKKYRNQCLFVFTYNMDKPGFSYYLLPNLKKYVIPVMLREGTGDRKAAVRYMRELIKGSQYAQYAKQANEFMKLFPGDTFTQTDVLMAYEQFEAWCLNKNVLKAYDYDLSEDFMLDRDENAASAYDKLQQMIGLNAVKKVIHKAIANYKLHKLYTEKGISKENASLHMVFTGNPGTAKTTVARLFAEILKDEKVLPTGSFVEAGRADLVGSCVGSTAPLVKQKFKEAQGGVLFIDEAYALCDGYSNGYGDEAIHTIVQEMENHREDVIVIFAGYPEPMQQFLDRNPGMRSRIAFQVAFEDYSIDELCAMTKLMLSRKHMTATEAAMEKLRRNYEGVHGSRDYGNGRFVRKMLEEAEMNLSERLTELMASDDGTEDLTIEQMTTLEACDIPEAVKKVTNQKRRIGFAVAD